MKYTIHSTHEDWEKLYQIVKKIEDGKYLAWFKKSQSYDSAVVTYASLTNDWKLKGLKTTK